MAVTRRKRRILIVDDETLNIRFLETLLSAEIEISVIFATSGEDALEIARGANKPELILLDVVMPGIDGHEVCRRLKADPETASIPVIFITMKDGAEDETAGLALGAVDYITKPFDPDAVQIKVRNHLVQVSQSASVQAREKRQDRSRRAGDRRIGWSPRVVVGLLAVLAIIGFLAVQFDLIRPGSRLEAALPQVDAEIPADRTAAPSTTTAPSSADRSTPRARVDLSWVADSRCGEIPEVSWWRFKTHGAVARYVVRNLNGDWPGYLAKWRERLENIRSIQDRQTIAITNTGVRLSGSDLDDYVTQMVRRVAILECLSTEAAQAARGKS